MTCCWDKSSNLSKNFKLTTLASQFWWLTCLGRIFLFDNFLHGDMNNPDELPLFGSQCSLFVRSIISCIEIQISRPNFNRKSTFYLHLWTTYGQLQNGVWTICWPQSFISVWSCSAFSKIELPKWEVSHGWHYYMMLLEGNFSKVLHFKDSCLP